MIHGGHEYTPPTLLYYSATLDPQEHVVECQGLKVDTNHDRHGPHCYGGGGVVCSFDN